MKKDVTKPLYDFDKNVLYEFNVAFAGMDEVGRGPLCGPVVVAAVVMPLDDYIEGVNDSKKISEKKRIALAEQIKSKALAYVIAEADNNEIDEINILAATKKCMKECVERLKDKIGLCLVDTVSFDSPVKLYSLIKGDATSYSIACASIVAKVYRDELMYEYDKIYPGYGFASNKGYGTAEHLKAIQEKGLTPIHRKTFTKNFVK